MNTMVQKARLVVAHHKANKITGEDLFEPVIREGMKNSQTQLT